MIGSFEIHNTTLYITWHILIKFYHKSNSQYCTPTEFSPLSERIIGEPYKDSIHIPVQFANSDAWQPVNESDPHIKLTVMKNLHLSLHHFRLLSESQACEYVSVIHLYNTKIFRNTYRLGEFRATRNFVKHHIDSTIRQSHSKINAVSTTAPASHSSNCRGLSYYPRSQLSEGPRRVVFPRSSVKKSPNNLKSVLARDFLEDWHASGEQPEQYTSDTACMSLNSTFPAARQQTAGLINEGRLMWKKIWNGSLSGCRNSRGEVWVLKSCGKVSSWKAVRGTTQPVGVKEGWFRRRGMDRVKEDIMVEEKKDEDHLLAVGVQSSHNEKHKKREWKMA